MKIDRRRTRFRLNQQAFDALLQRLDEDREVAGEKFEAFRRKLLQFFTYERCRYPDRWADETLDRVAKRLAEGFRIEEPGTFIRGVAKMVLREARLAERNEPKTADRPSTSAGDEAERDARCLDQCLARLSAENRRLIEAYYLQPSADTAKARKDLAARLGITSEALRSRALRIRGELQKCLLACRESEQESHTSDLFSPHLERDDELL